VEIYGIKAAPQHIEVKDRPASPLRTSFNATKHCIDIVLPDYGLTQNITIKAKDTDNRAVAGSGHRKLNVFSSWRQKNIR
jgi:hypothetical protein